MIKPGRLLAIALLALTGVAVQAQETGTLLKHKPAQFGNSRDDRAGWAFVEDFATCLVSKSPGRAQRLVALRVGSEDYKSWLSSLLSTGDVCYGFSAQINEMVLRGAIFQALYEREFGSNASLSFDPAMETGYRTIYGNSPSVADTFWISMEAFGECVAHADGEAVRTLIRLSPGSASEKEMFARLMPSLSACLPPGQKYKITRQVVKGFLAEGLYRLSVTARTKGSAG